MNVAMVTRREFLAGSALLVAVNTAYAAGGSSGGSAAAVAAGLTGLDIRSDSAGSIRIPASFCGIYGFKPTNGAVSNNGDWGISPPSRPPFLHLDRRLSTRRQTYRRFSTAAR